MENSEFAKLNYPKNAQLKYAMLVVLLEHGETGQVSAKIDIEAAKLLSLTVEQYEYVMPNGKRYLSYRMAWERSRARKSRFIEKVPNRARMWRLTEKGSSVARRKKGLFK
jgi:hypothetical protein